MLARKIFDVDDGSSPRYGATAAFTDGRLDIVMSRNDPRGGVLRATRFIGHAR